MADINEQRKRVEELKKKILEQKKKGFTIPPELQSMVEEPPAVPAVSIEQTKNDTPAHQELEPGKKSETRSLQEEQKKIQTVSTPGGPVRSTTVTSLKAYAQVLRQAWGDGLISKDEEEMLRTLRTSLSISDQEHESLQHEVQMEIYQNLVMRIWNQGSMSPQDSEKLDFVREKFNISAEEHMKIERHARQILLQKKTE